MHYDITSSSNDRIRWLARLANRRHRDDEGVFVVEGSRLYERAGANGLRPVITFLSDPTIATKGEVVTVEPAVLDKASYRSRSEGIIGVFPQLGTRLDAIDPGANPLLLVVEDIEKPGNLGAMARTACVSGASALIAVGDVDVHNPNALRSSTGAIFALPMAIAGWDELDPWLQTRGIPVVVATPGPHQSHWDCDLTGPTALVIGSERAGHSQRSMEVSHRQISIPQVAGVIDSLNASVAAGVLLFEAMRQRRLLDH